MRRINFSSQEKATRHKPRELMFRAQHRGSFFKTQSTSEVFLLFSSFSVTQIENKTIIYVGTAFIQIFYRDAERILNRHIFMYHCLQLRTTESFCHSQEPLGNQLPLCNGSSHPKKQTKKQVWGISGRRSTPLLGLMAHCSQCDISVL